jgi:hypothetical protein
VAGQLGGDRFRKLTDLFKADGYLRLDLDDGPLEPRYESIERDHLSLPPHRLPIKGSAIVFAVGDDPGQDHAVVLSKRDLEWHSRIDRSDPKPEIGSLT